MRVKTVVALLLACHARVPAHGDLPGDMRVRVRVSVIVRVRVHEGSVGFRVWGVGYMV